MLFSRPDTADILRVIFAELNAPISEATLDFFSYEQACQFLEKTLARRDYEAPGRDFDVALKNPVPYTDMRDRRLSQIAGALLNEADVNIVRVWKRPEIIEFLGYAPVLSVLAETFAVANPYAEKARNLEAGGARNVLLQVVDELLEREQKKFQNQTLDRLRAELSVEQNWPDIEDVYGSAEQSIRLVSRYLRIPYDGDDSTIPTSVRQSYEQAANQFIADHPFLAGTRAVNLVFSDYILAKAAVRGSSDNHSLYLQELIERVPGPFFYQFLFQFSSRDADSPTVDVALIQESLLNYVLESHLKSLVRTVGVCSILYQSEDAAVLYVTDSLSSGGDRFLSYSLVDVSGVLTLGSRLVRGMVVTDGGVVLGQQGSQFIFGPASSIICDELQVRTDVISVDLGISNTDKESCLFQFNKLAASPTLRINTPHNGALAVYGQTSNPAFRPFLRPAADAQRLAAHFTYVDLRAILKAFRQNATGLPSVYGELMDQRIVKKNPTRLKFLSRLMELGLVKSRPGFYYLDTARLARRSINWHAAIDGSPTESVMELLDELQRDEWVG